jgi:hypothetical protein
LVAVEAAAVRLQTLSAVAVVAVLLKLALQAFQLAITL